VIDNLLYDPERHGPLLTPNELRDYLWRQPKIKRSLQRLADYRCFGGGPAFIKQNGREVRYPECLADNWAAGMNAKPVLTVAPSVIQKHLRGLQSVTRGDGSTGPAGHPSGTAVTPSGNSIALSRCKGTPRQTITRAR
jgi:hypothetical protein